MALTIFLASSVGACAPTAEPPASIKLEKIANELSIPGEAELIDLTYPLSPDSLLANRIQVRTPTTRLGHE